MFNPGKTLHEVDPELWAAVQQENQRQEDHVELIASENYASPAVMAAQGTQLTNKYAEGYPGKRYYGGCEFVDMVEQLAIDRIKELFGAEHANVQPNSGSQANQGVFFGLLQPGDTIMGMSLAEGPCRKGHQQRDLPRHSRRPADACDRRQGSRVQGGVVARVQGVPAAGGEERRGAGRHVDLARIAHRQRSHREPRDAGRSATQ